MQKSLKTTSQAVTKRYKSHEMFFNRELSWIQFNLRVLEEAQDEKNPLLERLKFAAIFITNLDEFFMIRVSGLKEQIQAHIHSCTPDGLTPEEQIVKIHQALQPIIESHQKCLKEEILPALDKEKIRLVNFSQLNSEHKKQVRNYFSDKVFPVVTPLAIDPSHPFPKLRNLNINLIVELQNLEEDEPLFAVIPVPTILPPVLSFKTKDGYDFILLEDIIAEFLEDFFLGMKVIKISKFKITRNADLDISEAEADDLLKLIEKELRKRNLGSVIRLECDKTISAASRQVLLEGLENLTETDIYEKEIIIDPNVLWDIYKIIENKPHLKDEPFMPSLSSQILKHKNIFEAIKSKDILLWQPYESFVHVVDFIKEAAHDPHVIAIKITLYRTSGSKSPIVMALKEAIANGKNVTALIELKARFDEQKNITWAKELESEGVNVVYGVMGLKTHCKVCLVIRKEQDEFQHYVHLSTGNYNEISARIYTDISLFTCHPEISKDVAELFNFLTGYSKQEAWRQIIVAPTNMRGHFKELIQSCIQYHSSETPSSIRIVMNSLVDPEMIKLLYQASQAGISIFLIIRGICCLVPGLQGLSENITVKSIVGRFLEHSRIYDFYFRNKHHIYCGSADWMQRNLDRRVEVAFPILDPDNQQRILSILEVFSKGNVKARLLLSDGHYIRFDLSQQNEICNAQATFMEMAEKQRKDYLF